MMLRGFLAASAAIFMSAAAAADTGAAPFGGDGWYVQFGGKGEVQHQPRYVSNLFAPNGASVGTYSPKSTLFGPTGALGRVFADGTFPAWLGRNVRLELSGGWQGGGSKTNASTLGISGGGTYMTLTGTPIGYGFGANARVDGTLEHRQDQWELALTLRSDYALAPAWTLSPHVSITGGANNSDYLMRELSIIAPLFNRQLIEEKLRTTHVGLRAGATLTWQATAAARLNLGGFVGFAQQWTRYSGVNCSAATNVEFGSCNDPATGGALAFVKSSLSSTASSLAFLAGAHAGGSYDFGWMIVSLSGHYRYNSQVPGIRHPSPGDPRAAGAIFTGEHAYGGTVKVTIPLN
jgi:opacity protein-like surface antigen